MYFRLLRSNPTTTVITPTRKKTATPTTVISPLSQAAKLPPKLLPNTSRLPHGVVLPSAINKPTNGKANTGRLSFPDCKMHDLPFLPVESTLLRLCNLTPKDSSHGAHHAPETQLTLRNVTRDCDLPILP